MSVRPRGSLERLVGCIAALAWIAGCAGEGSAPAEVPQCGDTWASFGESYVRTWCTGCHSSALPADQRYGAPLGMDFDTVAGVQQHRTAALSAIGSDPPRMPPAGGPDPDEQERFATWLACGAVGEETTTPDGCDSAVSVPGDAVVSDAASAAALCDAPTAIGGGLWISVDASLPCLCDVGGTLLVSGGTVELPALRTTGGDLRVSGDAVSLSAPSLASVAGSVTAAGAVGLHTLHLPGLQQVGSDILVTDAPSLTALPLERLRTVGGDLVVSRDAALASVDLSRLETVAGSLRLEALAMTVLLGEGYALTDIGGDLVLASLPSWQGFYGFANLERIGGDLRIEDAPRIDRLRGFTLLAEVGGTLSVSRDARLGLLDGFDNLARVGGDLVVEDNPSLFGENAFARIEIVEGSLRVVDNPALGTLSGLVRPELVGSLHFEGDDALTTLRGFDRLQSAGALHIVDLPALTTIEGFDALAALPGDLELRELPLLDSLTLGAPSLSEIGGSFEVRATGLHVLIPPPGLRTIGADLAITDNPDLSDLSALHAVETVGRDLVVTGNPSLPAAEALALAAAIDTIGGTTTLSDNGP